MLPRTRVVVGLAATFVVAGSVSTRADQVDEATFVKRVLERSPRREVFENRRRAAAAQVAVASVLPNPTLHYEREAVAGLDASDDFLRLGWTIDLAGRRGLARSAAGAGADAERRDIDRDAFVFEVEARVVYLEAAYAREQLARLETARVPLAALVDALRSRAKQGDASSYDADRAALELDGLDDERATASRTLERAQLRLGALLGEPATRYEASDPVAMPVSPAATGAPRRPEIDAARARARQADREAVAAGRSWIPRLEIVAGVMSSSTSGGDGLGYIVGIGGELPLFDAGGAAGARARADARRWQSEARALVVEASGEAEQARRDLALRIAQAEAYLAGPATRAADLQRRATVAYREGDRPILELLDVQRSAKHAALRALELIYEARRAELTLRRALGGNP